MGCTTTIRSIAMTAGMVFLSSVLGLLFSAEAQAQAGEPNIYIAVFDPALPDLPSVIADQLEQQYSIQVHHIYEAIFKGCSFSATQEVADQVAGDFRLVSVRQELLGELDDHSDGDPCADSTAQILPHGVDRIDADLNSTANIDNVDDTVDADIAILDSAVDFNHEDLNVFELCDATEVGNRTRCGACVDVFGDRVEYAAADIGNHGTHVAGVAAARDNNVGVVGVAPGARIWAIRVFDDAGRLRESYALCGLDFVTAHANDIEVANMSFSFYSGASPDLRTAVQAAVGAGVVLITSAGNDTAAHPLEDVYGADGTLDTGDDNEPNTYPEVMTISAMADTDGAAGGLGDDGPFGTADDTMPGWSYYSSSVNADVPVYSPGAAIDLTAPGENVCSTLPNDQYGRMSGTSQSTPHVAGAVALYIAENYIAHALTPTNSNDVIEIRQALIDYGEDQIFWGFRGSYTSPRRMYTGDLDVKHERLVNVQNLSPWEPCEIIAIAAGGSHSLALKHDGTLWGWGGNGVGQLGNGTLLNSTVPVAVLASTIPLVSDFTDVQAIAAGSHFSLALKRDGTVWAWGWNSHGQLGNGTVGGVQSLPQIVPTLSDVKAIASGNQHALALLADGTVMAWGSNTRGQLGNGNTTDQSTPVQVSNLSNIIAIAAGERHSLAIENDPTEDDPQSRRKVFAWGNNDQGQLGDGSYNQSNVPVSASTATGLTDAIDIDAGTDHSMAVDSDGILWTWGNNVLGELGVDSSCSYPADHPFPVDDNEPRPVCGQDQATPGCTAPHDFLVGVMAIGGGFNYAQAVESDGSAWSWGKNLSGELGDGNTSMIGHCEPRLVWGIASVIDIDGSPPGTGTGTTGNHTLALSRWSPASERPIGGGKVKAWGKNSDGQLGIAHTNDSTLPRETCATYCGACSDLDLVIGGDFVVGLAPWELEIELEGGPAPEIQIVDDLEGMEQVAEITRPDFPEPGSLFAVQQIGVAVGTADSLLLSFDVSVGFQTFDEYDIMNVYPANVVVDYEDGLGEAHSFQRSFYVSIAPGHTAAAYAEQIPPGVWESRLVDLSDLEPPMARLTAIRFGSEGLGYQAALDNLALIIDMQDSDDDGYLDGFDNCPNAANADQTDSEPETTVFMEDFQSGSFGPTWDFSDSTDGQQSGENESGTWSSQVVDFFGNFIADLTASAPAPGGDPGLTAAVRTTVEHAATLSVGMCIGDVQGDAASALSYFQITALSANQSNSISYGFSPTGDVGGDIAVEVSPFTCDVFQTDLAQDYFNKNGEHFTGPVIIRFLAFAQNNGSAASASWTIDDILISGGPDGVGDACDNCVADYNPDQADCDNDGLGDICAIASGVSEDDDNDGIPDECACPTDFNGDGMVGAADLAQLLASWGPCDDCQADLNGDGTVGPIDLAQLLASWGPCE